MLAYLLIIMSLLAIHGIIDDLEINLYYNVFWLAIGSYCGKVNKNEKQEVLQMAEYINKYEKENNIKVEKIAFIHNIKEYNGKKLHYEDVKNMSGITRRATAFGWGCIGVIEFYSDIRLEKTDCTSEMLNNYISSNNKFLNDYMIDKDVLICQIYDW